MAGILAASLEMERARGALLSDIAENAVSFSYQPAAKAELKRYADIKGLGAELSKAMSNLDSPSERSDKDRQILARYNELNQIAEAPVAGPGTGGRFAGKPINESNQMSRAEAKAEIDRIEGTPGFWNEDTIVTDLETHRALVAKRDKLYKIAYPG